METQVLSTSIDFITESISHRLPCIHSAKYTKFIQNFSKILQYYDLSLQIDLKLKGAYCLYCDRYIYNSQLPQSIGLFCNPQEHFFCSSDCFKKHVLVSTNNTLLQLQHVLCPFCRLPIALQQIQQVFQHKIEDLQNDACDRALQQLLDDQDKQRMIARFTCQICYNQLKVQQGITLQCDHRFCNDCIRQLVEYLIENAQVSDRDLKCPNCVQPLTVYQIQDIVSSEVFKKYEKFRLRGIQVDEEGDSVFHCLGTDCEFFCIIDQNTTYFRCQSCEFKCCVKCKQDHEPQTCEEYQKWKQENDEGQNKLDELLEAEGLMKCPVCGVVIQKVDGCQFITCSSSQCQGQTYLCYLCGNKLDQDHGGHQCKPRGKPQPPVRRRPDNRRHLARRQRRNPGFFGRIMDRFHQG